MAEKRFYWLKLQEDFFRQREIKKLRQIAGGDTYVIIYLKLLLLALKTDGKLFYEGIEENFASEMALEIDEAEENVAVTVNFLIAKGILLSTSPSEYELTTCPEMAGSETDSARRMRLMRSRQASQCDTLPSHCSDVFGNVQKCDLIREDIEKEIDIDKTPADKPPVMSAGFEKFWSAYPKKVGKGSAKKAFSRVKVPVETLLTAVERQKCSVQWSKDNGQYIPNPATWLNQGRWEDELNTASGASSDEPTFIPDGKGGGSWIIPKT